ncbi:hypothetical protein GGX14DRAFT_412459 [Mycena pura]|uniref:Uncharacterized protein n=1 Tax=Mycena pura TaxID=153505 RepID=A0AAD6YSC7_9AGAR|nr:hypothetical protein GGX14DRAFT_412459 [Mycena pura]
MGPPDGFSTRKPRTKPIAKSSFPKFISGFDSPSTPTKQVSNAPQGFNAVEPKRASRALNNFIPAFDGPDDGAATPTKRVPKVSATLMVPKPPDPNFPNLAEPKQAMRAVKLPVPLFNAPKPAAPSPHAPRPPPPLPAPPQRNPNNTTLRQLALPPIPSTLIASSSKSTSSLKALAPPPPPAPVAPSSDRIMHTISTTLIARATDLFTDNGPSELASLLIQDQHPDIQSWSTPDDVDERRGIMVSPEKGRRGKEKFVRNGLAARARVLYDRHSASLVLWEAEMAHTLASSSSSSRRGLNPDMRLRILHILHIPTPVSGPSSKIDIPGVALCHILAAPTPDPLGSLPCPRTNDGACAVLLSFSSLAPSAHRQGQTQLDIRNPEDFSEGREVHVWKPWQVLAIDAYALKSSNSLVLGRDTGIRSRRRRWCANDLSY